jgi:hypothetical protein
VEVSKNLVYLIARQHDWQTCRFLGPLDIFNPTYVLFEDLLVKKQNRAQSLVLCRCRHVTNARQVSEKLRDLFRAHFARMTQMMESDKALDPIAIGSLRPQTVVLQTQDIARLVE